MNVTPAMIRPMEMTMSNSSNENPRFLPYVIGTLSGEEKPPVERALHPFTGNTGKIAVSARTKGRVRDLLSCRGYRGSEGSGFVEDQRRSTGGQGRDFAVEQ